MIINSRKIFTVFFVTLLSCLLYAQQANLIFRESYRLADVQNLVMALNSENVEIKNFRGYKVTVEFYSNNSSRSPVIKRANKSIIIENSREHSYKNDYCNIVIYIPYDFQMNSFDFISDSGSLSTEQIWASKISARSNSGSISMENVISRDTFAARSSKGFIKIGSFKGEYFELTNHSGNIEMNKVQAEYFNTTSSSGEVYIQLTEAPIAGSQISTNSGNIIVEIPFTENFNAQILSNSGTLRDNIKNIRKSARGEYEAKYNDGGAMITLKTTSGDITLE